MRAKTATIRTVALLAFDDLSLFEFSIACEVFGEPYLGSSAAPLYELLICAESKSIRTDRGLHITVPHRLSRIAKADTVIVAPTSRPSEASANVLRALQRAHRRGARILSLCNAAFVLAQAGLLDNRPATTHWMESDELAARFPSVRVHPDVLYVDDGDILTSAGCAASIDLCLHVVRQDYGANVAADIARELVVPPYRDGGQAQYIRTPLPDPQTEHLFTDTLAWLQEHLHEDITVAELAQRSAMSTRTFARRFVDTAGTTPYQWLLRQRISRAQQLLETTDEPVESIAAASGFGSAVNLRKHFTRLVNTSPSAYRHTFAGDVLART